MRSWLPTVCVSIAAFTFVTSEFLPVGLLPEIARDLHKTDAEAGLVMTIYAWLVALLSIPMTAATTRFDRRPLMLSLIALFVAAHVLTLFATTFEVLVAARFLVAVTHAVFWAISIPLGIRVAPAGRRERAMAIVATGAALGSVLGIPLGTLLGQLLGWRWGFGAVGAVASAVGAILFAILPTAPSQGKADLGLVIDLFRRPKLVGVYLLTVVMMTGQFSAFTFISPFLQDVGGVPAGSIATVLFVYGGAGLLSSFVSPLFMKDHLRVASIASISAVALCLAGLKFAVATWATILLLAVAWGVFFMFCNLALQSFVLTLAADAEDVAMAGFSGIYNVGIGGGALVGSLLVTDHLDQIGFAGGTLVAVACALGWWVTAPEARAKEVTCSASSTNSK